ncbi:MAG: penicillin-binding transpeptidase domain-containing protein, partial [Candidatus Marinimicrobia bacterium]|nr:penicillin-binding transpeptidase domain-containing protein [Candidatus Neomarinimicrobiota bacterium]
MKKTFLIISLLFLSVGFCQQIIHTETYDNGSLKSITYFNKTQYYGILFVKHEEYDENGYLDYEQIYKDGKRWDGKWTEWYENGQKRYERTYKDGKEDGKWTEWYSDGKKQYEGTYKGGRKNGIWTYWYENGEKIFKGTYLNGKENGSWHWWYNNGKKRLQGSFSNGEKTGEWLFFSTNDEPMSYNQEFSTKIYSSDGRMLDKLFNESKDLNPINSRNDEKNNHNIQGFVEYVRNSLRNKDLNIYRYGYNIHTSLDFRLQQIAEDAVYKSVIANQQKLNQRLFNDEEEFSKLAYLGIHPEDTVKLMMAGKMELYEDLRDKLLVQSSFVALDTRTGAILAMVGGRPDYPDHFNRATQSLRQPGSVFKPFVYTTAIDNGVPVTRQLLNQPVVLNVRNADGEWVKWMPKNYDGSSGGLTTIREGLRRSLNLISVRMVQEVVPAEEVK